MINLEMGNIDYFLMFNEGIPACLDSNVFFWERGPSVRAASDMKQWNKKVFEISGKLRFNQHKRTLLRIWLWNN